jgi:hypothetical protein
VHRHRGAEGPIVGARSESRTDDRYGHAAAERPARSSVELVDGFPDEYLAASHKALPEAQWSEFENQVRSIYPAMARISVTPQWANVLDFETRMPTAMEWLVTGERPTP